jgi:hypothetical protein
MTEDEIYQIFLKILNERKEARQLPWEPSRMEFAMKVAEIAYDRGWSDGHKSGRTGVYGDPQ